VPPGSRTSAGPAPCRRQQRVAWGSGLVGRGGRGAGRERSPFPGAARPWVRDDGRSAPPAASSPPPAGPTAVGGCPGLPALGPGERGKAPRTRCAAGQEGGPAQPEGKAGRAGHGVVPGGDLVRALAVAGGGGSRPGCQPAGRAGLPPGTAGIQPPLRPPRQVRPARCRGGLDTPPRATRRCGPAPARREWVAPHEGRPPGGYREGGTVARTAKVRTTVVHASARRPGTGSPGCGQRVILLCGSVMAGLIPRAAAFFADTTEIGFSGPFSPATPKIGAREARNTVVAGSYVHLRWPFVYLACPGRVPAGKQRRSAL
jgi:hypothetical protein